MKSKILILFFVASSALFAKANNEIPKVANAPYAPSENDQAFFPLKTGSVQVFLNRNADGVVTSKTKRTIKSITGDKNAFAIGYEIEQLDEIGKSVVEDNPFRFNHKVVISNGFMYFDMKEMFAALEDIESVHVIGSPLKIPTTLEVGQSIPDAYAHVTVGAINYILQMTEGKCIAIEDVKLQAGTFRCYKVFQKTASTVAGVTAEGTTIAWYAIGIGAIKSEKYDQYGNLHSSQELIVAI